MEAKWSDRRNELQQWIVGLFNFLQIIAHVTVWWRKHESKKFFLSAEQLLQMHAFAVQFLVLFENAIVDGPNCLIYLAYEMPIIRSSLSLNFLPSIIEFYSWVRCFNLFKWAFIQVIMFAFFYFQLLIKELSNKL